MSTYSLSDLKIHVLRFAPIMSTRLAVVPAAPCRAIQRPWVAGWGINGYRFPAPLFWGEELFVFPAYEGVAAVHLKFFVDVFDMVFDCFQRNVHPDGYFLVGESLFNRHHDLRLPGRQVFR